MDGQIINLDTNANAINVNVKNTYTLHHLQFVLPQGMKNNTYPLLLSYYPERTKDDSTLYVERPHYGETWMYLGYEFKGDTFTIPLKNDKHIPFSPLGGVLAIWIWDGDEEIMQKRINFYKE